MRSRIRRMALTSSCAVALGAFASAPAQAAVTATTLPATSITKTSAVLNGLVGTGGVATAYQFQYGKTKRYGKLTQIGVIGDGRGTVAVSSEVEDLKPGTTYHFRLLATTGDGTYYYPFMTSRGADLTFTTKKRRSRHRCRFAVRGVSMVAAGVDGPAAWAAFRCESPHGRR